MEEDTRSVHRDYPGKFSTVKYSWGEASTACASDREETCSAPTSGNETYGPEDTRKTARPNCVKTTCSAECTAPRWYQTKRWCSGAVGPCGCCRFFWSFFSTITLTLGSTSLLSALRG